jgi:hypothetical protein
MQTVTSEPERSAVIVTDQEPSLVELTELSMTKMMK